MMNIRCTCNKCGNTFTAYIEQSHNYVFELPLYICPNDYSLMKIESDNTYDVIVEGTQP